MNNCDVNAWTRTVQTRLKEWDLVAYDTKKKPLITTNLKKQIVLAKNMVYKQNLSNPQFSQINTASTEY